MTQEPLFEQLRAYQQWKEKMRQQLAQLRSWLSENRLLQDDDAQRLTHLTGELDSDRVTLAFVAEFSRGKTELINAIFFSEYQRRLLPSEPGRTTMCPTEIFFDQRHPEPYLRLLPIESRLQEATIADLKRQPNLWKQIHLEINQPDQLADAFEQIVQTKQVPIERARELGMLDEMQIQHLKYRPTEVDVPRWRHALINFPHPLLKQGLTLIDTPGLNALGAEPELTLEIIPHAQTIFFLLAADAGVTKSDLEVWVNYVKHLADDPSRGVIVALNKIDVLWDELRRPEIIEQSIETQRAATAMALGIGKTRVFQVSAQKGLLAKIKKDTALLKRSGLQQIEKALSDHILIYKQRHKRDQLIDGFNHTVRNAQQRLARHYKESERQRNELKELSGANKDKLLAAIQQTHLRQLRYQVAVEAFRNHRIMITKEVKALRQTISPAVFSNLATHTRDAMLDSWTTPGLKQQMRVFFNGVGAMMRQFTRQADKTNELLLEVYTRFQKEHGVEAGRPTILYAERYVKEFQSLAEEAENFRKSMLTTMTGQRLVVKKFFVSTVSNVHNLMLKANQDVEQWARTALEPLAVQINERRAQVDGYMKRLRVIKDSQEQTLKKAAELEQELTRLQSQLDMLEHMLDKVLHTTPFPDKQTLDYLAASMAAL